MTTQPIQEPLDRLNYYNGQRLEAKDLRTEQEYHIRVRRLLQQALYTPGIASGLEVSRGANAYTLTVSPGVALDALGREVILLEETEVAVRGLPNTDPGWAYSNFLFIQYAEQQTDSMNDGCRPAGARAELAWGGPTRIRAVPVLGFADRWPDEGAGQIILAQVELDGSCAVAQIHNQVRKYVDAVKPATRSFALEGEKNIDQENPKRLSFHVFGGPVSSVTLYLWSDLFSSLYYTQLGAHEHKIPELETSSVDHAADDLSHSHDIDLSGVETAQEDPIHEHDLKIPVNEEAANEDAVKLANTPTDVKWFKSLGSDSFKPAVKDGQHTHSLTGVHPTERESLSVPGWSHHHTTKTTTDDGEVVTTGATGQGEADEVIPAGKTGRLTYIDELKVYLDDQEITAGILAQLGGPLNGWETLSDGTSAHKLVTDGTGPIALERIAAIAPGEHTLEFKVDNESGGNIRYNLYVE